MKTSLGLAIHVLYLTATICCEAAALEPPVLDCDNLRYLAVINPEKPIEIVAQGFSVLPPKGESWCYRLFAKDGVGFFKIPKLETLAERPPTRDEFAKTHIFSAMALSLKGFSKFEPRIQNRAELETLVRRLISEHLFTQIIAGLATAQHRFRLIDSNVAAQSDASATCVRFEAKVEERGSSQAPDTVFILNLASNRVCRDAAAPDVGPIWVGFVERYPQEDQPTVDTLKGEYEPFVQSLRFMPPR